MRIWILGVVILLSGCSSFGRGVAEAILESGEKKDTRQCEIKGSKFNGIDYFFSEGNTVKVMMITALARIIPAMPPESAKTWHSG